MIYKANEPKFLWILLFILTITYAYVLESTLLTYLAYGISFIFFAAMTMSYQLDVREKELYRVITVFGFAVIKRVILANEIEKLDIIQVGERAIVLIHLKKKMRIKLQRYSPDGLTEQLVSFAHNHQIQVNRTGNRV
jgi:hypothetical protein